MVDRLVLRMNLHIEDHKHSYNVYIYLYILCFPARKLTLGTTVSQTSKPLTFHDTFYFHFIQFYWS